MNIKLETLNLVRYNPDKHKYLKEEFKSGNSYSSYIYSIEDRLELSKNNNNNIFHSAFVIEDNTNPIGYLYISSLKKDIVFLEYAILKDYRKMGYGSKIVNEISNYLFINNNIKSIKLDIDPGNKYSIALALSCGFTLDYEEYESRNYQGRMQFVKDNDYYIVKKHK